MDLASTNIAADGAKLLRGLGSAVIVRRQQLNVTQDELCKRSGINKSMVVRLESGLLDVDLQSLFQLSSALDSTVSSLLEMAEAER